MSKHAKIRYSRGACFADFIQGLENPFFSEAATDTESKIDETPAAQRKSNILSQTAEEFDQTMINDLEGMDATYISYRSSHLQTLGGGIDEGALSFRETPRRNTDRTGEKRLRVRTSI